MTIWLSKPDLRKKIEATKKVAAEKLAWYTNPDNMEKPEWRQVKSDYNNLIIKIQTWEDALKTYRPALGIEEVKIPIREY